jgi:hypothetical protein
MRAITRSFRATLGTLTLGLILLGASSCGDEYTYFTISLNLQTTGSNPITQAERLDIDHCMLEITNEAGEAVEGFLVAKSGELSDGKAFGCAYDHTPSFIGQLNYSSLRKSGALTFDFSAGSGEGGGFRVIAKGIRTERVNPGKSVRVEIIASK